MSRQKYIPDTKTGGNVGRAHSALSVSAVDYCMHLPVSSPPSPAISTITLTPGRSRNIDLDMEALRASRQDNPFIKQVIASRESLIESLEEESDHANLMSRELSIDIDIDPLSLPEMHEHMIRSPPPTTWAQSPNFQMFQFPMGEEDTLQIEVSGKDKSKSDLKPTHSSWEGSEISPLKSLKPLYHPDMFSLLTTSALRDSGEESIHLIAED